MNVLTIDIDYAFSPSISLYDDFVIGSRIDYVEQQKILENNKCGQPVLNHSKFNELKNLVSNLKNTSRVYQVEHHHDILNYIKNQKEVYLQNIDHHHDIFYPGWHELNNLDEGNWVYHLSQICRLKEYTWFRNKDSEDFCNSIDLNFIFNEEFNLQINKIREPDIIVVCSSPHWTFDTENLLVKKLLESIK